MNPAFPIVLFQNRAEKCQYHIHFHIPHISISTTIASVIEITFGIRRILHDIRTYTVSSA